MGRTTAANQNFQHREHTDRLLPDRIFTTGLINSKVHWVHTVVRGCRHIDHRRREAATITTHTWGAGRWPAPHVCPDSASRVKIINESGTHNVGSTASSLSRHDIEARIRGSIQTELAPRRAATPGSVALTNVGPPSPADHATPSSSSSFATENPAWCTKRRIRFSPSNQPCLKIVSHNHPS